MYPGHNETLTTLSPTWPVSYSLLLFKRWKKTMYTGHNETLTTCFACLTSVLLSLVLQEVKRNNVPWPQWSTCVPRPVPVQWCRRWPHVQWSDRSHWWDCPLQDRESSQYSKTLAERPAWWNWKTTPLKDHPHEKSPRWKTILMKTERPAWWPTTLLKDHPHERPPWC